MSKLSIAGMNCVMVNSKGLGRITEQYIFGAKHLVIEGTGSIIANTVMNDIFYPEEELIQIAKNGKGWIHAPNGHPTDENGNFVPAGSPQGIAQGYIGVISGNYRMENRRLVRDIAINIEVAEKSEAGRELLRRVRNNEDVDTSTGLLFKPVNKAGVGEDGETYSRIATNIMLDHDAILLTERGAATSDQGVGMFANSADESVDVVHSDVTANASIPATTLEVVDIEYDEEGALNRIKEYTKSADKPGYNYRRFFLQFDRDNAESFNAYSMPFADVVDGKPVAVLSQIRKYKNQINSAGADGLERAVEAIERYSSAHNSIDKEDGIVKRVSKKVMDMIASIMKTDYNQPVVLNSDQPEGNPMKDKIMAALSAAGVKTEGLSDDQIFNAYADLMGKKKEDESGDKVANAINTALAAQLKPLQDHIKSLETSLNASKDAELTALAAQVEALDVGLNAASAKLLGVEGMKAVIAKNAGTVNFNSALNSGFASKGMLDTELPE